ncbi:hypothetical protein [Streptomyces synnematoformans]|uniref:Hydrogenase expression protein HypF n=1 Tax=Streptomyces synnematoformans TaxID=415721 RepID=A0ABP5KDI3_9ACTN
MRPDDQTGAVHRGPRHAAPRRPLLGRVPAGKAIALAAMPTAVFLGLGLTPRPAIAEDDPADRWRPGPCAEQSDEPKGEETADDADDADDGDAGDAADAAEGDGAPGAGEPAEPGGEPSPSPSAAADGPAAEQPDGDDEDGSGAGAGGAEDSGQAEPSPSPSESRPWYDPLGLGGKIGDLLNPDEPESGSEPEPEPEPSDGADGSGGDSGSGGSGGGDSGAAADEEQSETEKAIRDAADKAGATVAELDDKVEDTAENPADETPDTGAAGDGAAADADGREPFPCPTADPEALANAELEAGLPLLPDDPWRLESTKLTLKGLKYHGIVEVQTYSGAVKKVLKYTAADGVDIRDLHQTAVGPGKHTSHVRADKGSTSTIRDGTVTMYTEELKGNLFGLIPMTFSPKTPPPLDLPFAFFTDVQVIQAGQFGGTLTVPGLENTID